MVPLSRDQFIKLKAIILVKLTLYYKNYMDSVEIINKNTVIGKYCYKIYKNHCYNVCCTKLKKLIDALRTVLIIH